MSSLNLKETENGIQFKVKVQPRSGRNEIKGIMGDALKIKITAPPVDGEANEACLRLLAQWLEIPKGRVSLLTGQTSTQKVVLAQGVKKEELLSRLDNLVT